MPMVTAVTLPAALFLPLVSDQPWKV